VTLAPDDIAAIVAGLADALTVAPIGLDRHESARFVGVSETLFDEMVEDGRMPAGHLANSRVVWDREELRAAFKKLPRKPTKTAAPEGVAAGGWAKMK
jgi:hypothetical protein